MVNRFDQYDSPQALAADLVSVYDQLKQAMLELFGGHSTFALSLKEGFSNAFRSLNEMQGLRVNEGLSLSPSLICSSSFMYFTSNIIPAISSKKDNFITKSQYV